MLCLRSRHRKGNKILVRYILHYGLFRDNFLRSFRRKTKTCSTSFLTEYTLSHSSRRNIWRSSRSSRTCSVRWPAPKPPYGCHRDLCSCFLTVYILSYSSRRNIWKSSRSSRTYSGHWPAPKPPFCSGSYRRKQSGILKNSRPNRTGSRKASIRRYG